MRTLVGLLSVTLAMLSACGGGGGGGSSEPTAATPPVQSSAFRTLRVGDQWIYDAVGIGDNGLVLTGTGTDTIVGGVITPSGTLCYVTDSSATVSYGSTQRILHVRIYVKQDATGAIYRCGDNYVSSAGERFIDNLRGVVLVLPGTLSVGLVYSYVNSYTTGEWSDCSVHVDGYESVPTAAGTFNAYKSTETCTSSHLAIGQQFPPTSKNPNV